MTRSLSRREFLIVSKTALLALPFLNALPARRTTFAQTDARLGRLTRSLRYYEKPTRESAEKGFYVTDKVIEIIEEDSGERPKGESDIWLRTKDGWLNSSYIQPVREELNTPSLEIPRGGFLAEVTVPFTQSWLLSDGRNKRSYRFYYGSTCWVTFASKTDSGDVWYVVSDDLYKRNYLVYGPHLRRIEPKELDPISPNVRDKHIEVDLTQQKLTAFEGSKAVFNTQISTGRGGTRTPIGEFTVERKQPSRHMAQTIETGGFDLPAVPWVSFILWTGISIHGTYWHNNFGQMMSHGCINLTPEAARWVYLWNEPVLPYEKHYIASENGTKVVVFE